ncbi:MBL fold metallo-hydrolase [Amycolatopsis sp. QT-25]|uniref:MBL fold metallo-hydrolase n=1 Tax=Amycolatopsis sp. QT-25 TaxID=3034022 RepID=UPI0023EC59C8|nr:MBL fold metallo-hydrolase [Amycolatopsis sp. QT-25]WET83080.1 MBL fold metallo-hydrolase [Amycolatopsis sp. QT-25]
MSPAEPRPYLTELADGVFGYIQPDGGWCVSNSGVITGGGEVALVDTLATASRTLALRVAVADLAAGPVRTVINTHFHGDHTFGNQFFPDSTLIGHRQTRTEMLKAGLGLTRLWPDVDWGQLRVTPPTVLLDDRATLYVGDREVRLIHVGPAHTTTDVVVWLPEERVLFAGDVLMSGCTPFILMGSLAGSLEAIDELARLDARVVLSGHGRATGPEVLEANARYLRWLGDVAAAGRRAGLSPLKLARNVGLGEFGELLDPERIVGNLHRAYAEVGGAAPGADLDVLTIFAEMVEFGGGRPPACWA